MKYKFKTKPYRHQVKAIKKALPSLRRERWAALFMPMRSGKTKTAIDLLCILQLKYGVKRVLIVCPLSVVGVWRNQLRIHKSDDYKFKYMIVNYEMVYDRQFYEDGTWEAIPRKKLYKFNPEVIIVDESHKIGNPTAVQSRELYKLQRDIESDPFKIVLTGTPFHRKPLMVFGQFKFLHDKTFGTSFSKFKNKYSVTGGYAGFKVLRYKNQAGLLKRISRGSFLMKTLPFVPPQHEVVPYALKESEPAYISMANDAVAWIGDGVIEAPIALVKALRLAQLCGGIVRDSEGVVQRVGKEKRRAFEGLVEQFVDNEVEKLVVLHRFIPEIKDSIEVLRKAGYKVYLMHGKTPRNKREQRIADFAEVQGKAAFVAQVATGSLGIDLSVAAVTVFYSLPESLVTYDQACARIRKWKDKRTLTYYYLIGDGTIEEVNLTALKANLNLIDALERDPQLLSYSARG